MKEKRPGLKDYLKTRRLCLLLTAVFIILIVLVYRLYGLPWGPAVYVIVLDAAITLAALAAGYPAYRRRLRSLEAAIRQGSFDAGQLPPPCGAQEAAYQQLARAMQQSSRKAADELNRWMWESGQYYMRWSHQIKTPIAGIRLLLQEEEPDTGQINRELYKIEQYVEMVLQYQRLEADSADLVLNEYDLASIVKQALKKTAVLFRHKDLTLKLGDLDCRLVTDEKQLAFVMEQLITNAVKYTPKGSVFVGLEEEDGKRLLVVRDTGIGIREEDLPRIFEWGYTGYNGRIDRHSTGIGLSLCRQTLALLGHDIFIRSQPGKGTTVFVDLTQRRQQVD